MQHLADFTKNELEERTELEAYCHNSRKRG